MLGGEQEDRARIHTGLREKEGRHRDTVSKTLTKEYCILDYLSSNKLSVVLRRWDSHNGNENDEPQQPRLEKHRDAPRA
jgi:hypothetical protein